MTSPFFGLDVALRALRSQQALVDIANHNIANANTPGYSRQTATLRATAPHPVPGLSAGSEPGQVGSGVDVASIQRMRDTFADFQLRGELSSQARANTRYSGLLQVEAVFNEPSPDGLSGQLTKYWQAWQEVANSPSDQAARANLVQRGQSVADVFTRTHEQLRSLQRDLDSQVALTVRDLNGYAQQIAALNEQVVLVENTGLRANDLRDQRDQLLDELSKLARVTYVESANGSVGVHLGGRQLVDRGTVHELEAIATPGEQFASVQWAGGGQRVALSDGKLAGLVETRDQLLGARLVDLDALAARVIESVNGLHVSGVGLDGSQNVAFFAGSDAESIRVSSIVATDLDKVAAGWRNADGTYAIGDSRNAVALAGLQQTGTQRHPSSSLYPGVGLYGGTVSVAGVDVSGASPNTNFSFAVAGSTITVTNTSNGASTSFDASSLDTPGEVLILDDAALGVRLTLAAGPGASPAAVAAGSASLALVTSPVRTSIGDQYAAQIAALGLEARAAQGQSASQEVLVEYLQRRREETSGVSLDEETANLVRYQHAYQAAARVMTVMDTMLERLINGTGLVGR
jgi:flagellar hook-associated protein 1 FlgK